MILHGSPMYIAKRTIRVLETEHVSVCSRGKTLDTNTPWVNRFASQNSSVLKSDTVILISPTAWFDRLHAYPPRTPAPFRLALVARKCAIRSFKLCSCLLRHPLNRLPQLVKRALSFLLFVAELVGGVSVSPLRIESDTASWIQMSYLDRAILI